MSEAPETARIIADPLDHLNEQYGEAIQQDEREGYEGIIVDSSKLVDVATTLRDDLGYDFLGSLNYVDYLDDGFFEVVYNVYNTKGGPGVNIKARTPRDAASLPSLVSVWPGADFQEREAWDLMGIRFEGHPDLRRILLWEGFEGHPMRKDWHEAFYEEEHKPYGSRWPGGNVERAEMHVPYGMNVQYPEGFTLEDWTPEGTGQKQRLNCDRWQRDSLTWFIYWMQNLPGAGHRLTYRGHPLTNWWTFIGDFDGAMARGMGLVNR